MDARLLSGDAGVAVFPMCVNVTTLGAPDPIWRHFEANVTGVGSIRPPVAAKGKQRRLHSVEVTGPSEVSVWPSVPDAEVAAFSRKDAAILDTPAPIWQDLATDVPAVDWILPPLVEKREQWALFPVVATGPAEASVWPSILDVTQDSGDGIATLEIIAETGDEATFVQAANEIDWSQRPATDFARAVRLALATGAYLLARKLAEYGHRLYPNHQELAKMAHILAPPRVVRTDIPPAPSLQANQEWLRVHCDEYRGQWVALRDGILLATAATTRQLRAYLESTDGVLITKVF